jgi:hypothetical protein
MIVHLRKWIERMKFILLFLVLTYIMTHLCGYLSVWIEPKHSYQEPRGHAVKVFGEAETSREEASSFTDRLKLFYWYGE